MGMIEPSEKTLFTDVPVSSLIDENNSHRPRKVVSVRLSEPVIELIRNFAPTYKKGHEGGIAEWIREVVVEKLECMGLEITEK